MCTTYLYITQIILVTLIITHVQLKPKQASSRLKTSTLEWNNQSQLTYLGQQHNITCFSRNSQDIHLEIVIKYFWKV